MFGRGVLILPSCAAAMSGPLALLAQNPSNAVEADEPMAAPPAYVWTQVSQLSVVPAPSYTPRLQSRRDCPGTVPGLLVRH